MLKRLPLVATMHNYRFVCVAGALFRDGAECRDCIGTHAYRGVLHGCYRGSRIQSVFPAVATTIMRRTPTIHDNVDQFVVMTEFGKRTLSHAGCPLDRIVAKPHFTAPAPPRARPPSESNLVLFAGRLEPLKGLETLLAAWDRAETGDMRLIIAGDGPLESEIRAIAQRPDIDYVGQLAASEISDLLCSARALVFPSLPPESFGLSIIDAMAHGTPVIASDHEPQREVVGEHGVPWMAEAGDVDAWARSLERLRDGDTVDAWGRQAHHLAATRYSPAAGLKSLEHVYERAIEHHMRTGVRA